MPRATAANRLKAIGEVVRLRGRLGFKHTADDVINGMAALGIDWKVANKQLFADGLEQILLARERLQLDRMKAA